MPELRVLAPERAVHRDEMLDLISKVFSWSGYFKMHSYLRDGYLEHSHYDWAASRIGVCDGRIVSHFGVWDYQTRVGRAARLRTGGIGVVATHGDYRKRGFMEKTAMASVRAMRERGYDISILFGIDNFYHRFGYTRAWSDERYTISVGDLPSQKVPGRLIELPARPDRTIARIYNRCFAGYTGTAVRPTYKALHNPGRSDMACRGWGSARRPAGYVLYWVDRQTLTCCEACGDVETALRALGMLARDARCTQVTFETLPYTSELARRLRRDNVDYSQRHRRCGGAMICTVNLTQALSKMAGELSNRLRRSPMADWRGRLSVHGAGQAAELIADGKGAVTAGGGSGRGRGRSPHSIQAGDAIGQLLIGTDEALETAESYKIRLRGDAASLLPVLFPAQHPSLHVADRY